MIGKERDRESWKGEKEKKREIERVEKGETDRKRGKNERDRGKE